MQTIIEYIQKKHAAEDKNYAEIYAKAIQNHIKVDYPITFGEFINTVTPEVLAKTLKYCWHDAAKDSTMGRFNYVLNDGIFAVEIMTMPSGFRTNRGKWWREVFVKNEDIKPTEKFVASYAYINEFHKAGENGACSFQTKWGDRLAKIAPDYLEYLKKHFDDLK